MCFLDHKNDRVLRQIGISKQIESPFIYFQEDISLSGQIAVNHTLPLVLMNIKGPVIAQWLRQTSQGHEMCLP